MAIMEGTNGNETDLMQLWSVITELGEQLSQNRAMSVSLYSLAGNIKVGPLNLHIIANIVTQIAEPGSQLTDWICSTPVSHGCSFSLLN